MKRATRGIRVNNRDTSLLTVGDVAAAVGLLTRLPMPVDTDRAMARGARAAWAYPLVGALIGAIMAALAALLLWLSLPAGIAAALVLALSVILTGAMHEDGLADAADGLWGGWDKQKRLEIMKDSHIGVYGVVAIGLALLIRWLALAAIVQSGLYWGALIAVGALSRAGMVGVMSGLPNARDTGLSHSVGRPETMTGVVAFGLATIIAVVCFGFGLIFPACMAAQFCGLVAKAKIGGQTGDILGATQQVTEMVLLVTVVGLISS